MKIIFVLLLGLISACSSKQANEPAKLEPLVSPIGFSKVWSRDAGIGDSDLSLFFNLIEEDSVLITIDNAGLITFIDKNTGRVTREHELKEEVLAGLGSDSRHFYYCTAAGDLVALDKSSLKEVWREFLAAEVTSVPVSNDELVVVHTSSEALRAFAVNDGAQAWTYTSVPPILTIRGAPVARFDGDNLLTTFANGELVQFDWRSGEQNWQYPLSRPKGRTELERLVDPDGGVFIDGKNLFAVGFQGDVVSLDSKTGGEYWKRAASSFNGLAVFPETVVATLDDGVVSAYRKRNSMVRWSTDSLLNRRLSTPVEWGKYVLVPDFEGYVHLLDASDGTLLGRIRPDDKTPISMRLGDESTLYIYLRDGDVVAYRLS